MTKYNFLSDEWITAAREIADSYADDLPEPAAEIRLNVTINDVPHRDGESLEGHIDTVGGAMVIEIGHLDNADAKITVDYATAQPLLIEPDAQALMALFMGGKILVEGDVAKLVSLQTLEPDPDSMALGKEIAEITVF